MASISSAFRPLDLLNRGTYPEHIGSDFDDQVSWRFLETRVGSNDLISHSISSDKIAKAFSYLPPLNTTSRMTCIFLQFYPDRNEKNPQVKKLPLEEFKDKNRGKDIHVVDMKSYQDSITLETLPETMALAGDLFQQFILTPCGHIFEQKGLESHARSKLQVNCPSHQTLIWKMGSGAGTSQLGENNTIFARISQVVSHVLFLVVKTIVMIPFAFLGVVCANTSDLTGKLALLAIAILINGF